MESIRQKQVGELVRRNISIVLQQEGKYMFEDAFVTVTSVKMSPDLGIAKIYLSVYNTVNKQGVVLGMEEHQVRLRQLLSQRIRRHVRRIPEIHFYLDDTLDEMYRLNALFDELEDQNQMGRNRAGEEE